MTFVGHSFIFLALIFNWTAFSSFSILNKVELYFIMIILLYFI